MINFDLNLLKTKQIQDFVPYNEAIFWDYSKEYYLHKGILAWSNKAPKIIPHRSGTNYQNALAFAKLIKEFLKTYPSNERITVLECGCGSGRFARHFLLALNELEISQRIKYLVSDFSAQSLQEIQNKKILESIDTQAEVELIKLDVTDIKFAQRFNGKAYKLDSVSVIYMHYLLDTMPLTILKKNPDNSFDELYVSTSLRADIEIDIFNNDFLQSRLQKEFKWQPYQWEEQSKLEQDYKNLLTKFCESKSPDQDIFYHYTAIKAIQELSSILDEQGFLFSSDIKPQANPEPCSSPNYQPQYTVIGNSIGHKIENQLFEVFTGTDTSYISQSSSLDRWLYSKNLDSFLKIKNLIIDLYEKQKSIEEYIELEKYFDEAKDLDDQEYQSKLNKLIELAPYSAHVFKLKADYLNHQGDSKQAGLALTKAQSFNFWNDI